MNKKNNNKNNRLKNQIIDLNNKNLKCWYLLLKQNIMAKYKKVSEQTRKSFMEKLFYYLGKGLTPTVVKTMSKKDPKFANKWSQLQKNRKELERLLK